MEGKWILHSNSRGSLQCVDIHVPEKFLGGRRTRTQWPKFVRSFGVRVPCSFMRILSPTSYTISKHLDKCMGDMELNNRFCDFFTASQILKMRIFSGIWSSEYSLEVYWFHWFLLCFLICIHWGCVVVSLPPAGIWLHNWFMMLDAGLKKLLNDENYTTKHWAGVSSFQLQRLNGLTGLMG